MSLIRTNIRLWFLPIRIKVHVAERVALAQRARIAVYHIDEMRIATRQSRQRLTLAEARIRRIQAGHLGQLFAAQSLVVASGRADNVSAQTVTDQVDAVERIECGQIVEGGGENVADFFRVEGGPFVEGVHEFGGVDGLSERERKRYSFYEVQPISIQQLLD